jgi:hypothetical protein
MINSSVKQDIYEELDIMKWAMKTLCAIVIRASLNAGIFTETFTLNILQSGWLRTICSNCSCHTAMHKQFSPRR